MAHKPNNLLDGIDLVQYGQAIKTLRKAKRMTLANLSEKAQESGLEGCGINALSEMERGTKVRDETLLAIPKLFNCKDKTPQGLINEANELSAKNPFPKNMQQFGASIAIIRDVKNITQEQLADKLAKLAKTGCNKNIVSAMELGEQVNPIWPPLVSKALKCKKKTMQGVIEEADELHKTDRNAIPSDLAELGKNIGIIRRNRRLTIEGLAEKATLDRSTVSSAENGESVSKESLIKIAKGLNCAEPTIAGIAAEIHLMNQKLAERTTADISVEDKIQVTPVKKATPPKKPSDYLAENGANEQIEGLTHEQAWRIINKHMISNGKTVKDIAREIHIPDDLVLKAYRVISKDPEKRKDVAYLKEEYMKEIPKIFIKETRKQNYTELERQAVAMPILSMNNIKSALEHFAEKSEHDIDGLDEDLTVRKAYGIAKNSLGFSSLSDIVVAWEKETGRKTTSGGQASISDDAIDLTSDNLADSWAERIGTAKTRNRTSFRDL